MDDNDVTKTVKTERLQAFIESEVKSCSFDLELIKSKYVNMMWGGNVAIDEIATGLTELERVICKECGNPNFRNR